MRNVPRKNEHFALFDRNIFRLGFFHYLQHHISLELIEKLLGRLTRKLPEVPAATIVNKEEGGKKKKKKIHTNYLPGFQMIVGSCIRTSDDHYFKGTSVMRLDTNIMSNGV